MNTKLRFICAAFFVWCAALAYAAGTYYCQLDNTAMYFTGKSRTEYGKLLYQYKCPNGHIAWVVQ